jgi:hypothetical protein
VTAEEKGTVKVLDLSQGKAGWSSRPGTPSDFGAGAW